MKQIRKFLTLMVVAAILLASTLSASAIGFEAEEAYESVFVIYSGNSLGSGFAIGENCIITNAHVISNPKSITIVTYGGDEHRASVLGINELEDIAVLVVEDAKFPYLDVADLSDMKTGDDIYAIGAPKGMAYTLTKGGVSSKERIIGDRSYIQIDAAVNEGNSGGPLLNDAGQVLGVNTLKMSDSEGIGLAIPISRVCDYLKKLGIELNDNGNVVGSAHILEEKTPSDTSSNGNDGDDEDKKTSSEPDSKQLPSSITYVAVVVAALSLLGNIILTILLIFEKKRNIVAPCDPRERTDFEIDIME